MRANEANEVLADANKLRTETGWAPSFPLDRSLADTLEYWRSLADRPAQAIAAHSDEEKGLP
jgi:nucleoside-diphosphate-sugar epimerase